MKAGNLAIVASALIALAGCQAKIDPATSRLSVKHGLDPDAATIDMTPKAITVADLSSQKLPDSISGNLEDFQNKRAGPFEKQVWTVDAHIKSVQLRKDGDYYMEIQDSDGNKSVVEVPDPKLCKGSPLEGKIASTRKELEEKYHPTSAKQEVDDAAKIDGVGFMGWHGRPNGGRLMPGTGIDFEGGSSTGSKKGSH